MMRLSTNSNPFLFYTHYMARSDNLCFIYYIFCNFSRIWKADTRKKERKNKYETYKHSDRLTIGKEFGDNFDLCKHVRYWHALSIVTNNKYFSIIHLEAKNSYSMHQSFKYIQVLSILFVRLQIIFACPCKNCLHKHTIHMDGRPTKGRKFSSTTTAEDMVTRRISGFTIFPFFLRYNFDGNFSDLFNGIWRWNAASSLSVTSRQVFF